MRRRRTVAIEPQSTPQRRCALDAKVSLPLSLGMRLRESQAGIEEDSVGKELLVKEVSHPEKNSEIQKSLTKLVIIRLSMGHCR
jgi:hypothetical protein